MDKYTVFGADGSADVAASAASYGAALTAWKSKNEVPTEVIEKAVEAVFDANPNERLQMPALTHAALTELKATPAQHAALSARVVAYVQGQCGLKEARNTGRLDIQKGFGGGVLRLAAPGQDIPARPAKK